MAALHVAAADSKPAIVDRALDCTQSVTSSLFKGVGIEADSIIDISAVLETAMRNTADLGLSIKACEMVPIVAEKLTHASEKVCLVSLRVEVDPFTMHHKCCQLFGCGE